MKEVILFRVYGDYSDEHGYLPQTHTFQYELISDDDFESLKNYIKRTIDRFSDERLLLFERQSVESYRVDINKEIEKAKNFEEELAKKEKARKIKEAKRAKTIAAKKEARLREQYEKLKAEIENKEKEAKQKYSPPMNRETK